MKKMRRSKLSSQTRVHNIYLNLSVYAKQLQCLPVGASEAT